MNMFYLFRLVLLYLVLSWLILSYLILPYRTASVPFRFSRKGDQ